MFKILNSYLLQHKSISIPGLGSICLETLPATADFVNKAILPPSWHFRFDKYFDAPDKEFFSYLASHKNIADYEAIRLYNEFSFNLRDKIRADGEVNWEGVGLLKKDNSGSVSFESSIRNPQFLQAVPAHRVIRQNAQHVLLVGDQEKTTVEMNEWLHEEVTYREKESWWIYALILAAISFIILFFHFYKTGWQPGAVSNQQTLELPK